jgi:hypothetical protein
LGSPRQFRVDEVVPLEDDADLTCRQAVVVEF